MRHLCTCIVVSRVCIVLSPNQLPFTFAISMKLQPLPSFLPSCHYPLITTARVDGLDMHAIPTRPVSAAIAWWRAKLVRPPSDKMDMERGAFAQLEFMKIGLTC